jgi:hypothetical protein
MIYGILICVIIILIVVILIQYFSIQIFTSMIAEFEKWANHYGYTFLDVDHSIKYPDTVNKISGVIDEIEDIVKNGYNGNGGK